MGVYIDTSYQRINPSLPVPPPTKDGLVGLACPICLSNGRTTPMKYINYLPSGAYKVACGIKPRRGTLGHYYRTWSGAQLRHEVASINAGHWPPLAYCPPKAPALPISNGPTTSNSTPNASQELFQQLFQPTGSHTHPLTPKVKDSIICCGVGGQTGASHKTRDGRKGNKKCLYQACASCCISLGQPSRPCPAKGHSKKEEAPMQAFTGGAPAIHPPFKPSSSSNSIFPPNPSLSSNNPAAAETSANGSHPASLPTHKRIPLQSAPTGGTLAQEFSDIQLAAFFELREARLQSISRTQQVEANESKTVSVIAWLKPNEEPDMFTFVATKWPSFSLQQCQFLVNEAALVEGHSNSTWCRALSVWKHNLNVWCTTPIDVPARHPIFPRTILVKAKNLLHEQCTRFDWMSRTTYETAGPDYTPMLPETPKPTPSV
ncbi:uncharacterized protein MELLADRAFT_76378, partial [Melampsora larici-populina 98AG31]